MEDDHAASPLRVVVASPDARFLKLVRFLLPRRGLLVHPTQRPDCAEQLVERHSADVLVLDGGRAPAAADSTATRLRMSNPSLAVVVVAETASAHGDLRSRPVEKWVLPGLASEIRHAHGQTALQAGPALGVAQGAAVHT